MGRRRRIIQIEFPYHLTCRTNNRDLRFHKKAASRAFARALAMAAKKYSILFHHVVLMGDHYHIIATATENNLHRAMQMLNSRFALVFNRATGRSGHLWGDRYRSCIIDTDDYYFHAVRYIYNNPVRARIAAGPSAYEDSTCRLWAFGKDVAFQVVDDHLVQLTSDREGARRMFRSLVGEQNEAQPTIPRMDEGKVRSGLRYLFFGSAAFVQQMFERHIPAAAAPR